MLFLYECSNVFVSLVDRILHAYVQYLSDTRLNTFITSSGFVSLRKLASKIDSYVFFHAREYEYNILI